MLDIGGLRAALETRYEIIRQVAKGGMATVFLARDPKHERLVAVKVLDPELAAVLGTDRFLAEVAVTAGLLHPNIVPLFDSGDANGMLYFVMPFVEGESLRARLQREHELPVSEALRIAGAVARALDFAHRKGIVHRDVKPENILLQDGEPLVSDFGISFALSNAGGSRITQTGVSLGTPQYMSPEQASGDRLIDGRSDVYSLACVLYEMLTGDPPFTGATGRAIIARQLVDAPRPMTTVRSSIPPNIEAAVQRALAKVPADRFPTANEFADALGASATAGGRVPAIRRFILPSLTRRALAGGAALAVVAASAWAVGQTLHRRQPTSPAITGGQSLAVLFLTDVTPGGALGFLADGLTESLIDTLRRRSDLHVISSDGVGRFRGSPLAPDSIARALRVQSAIRGEISRHADSVRVAVWSVDAASGIESPRTLLTASSSNVLDLRDRLTTAVLALLGPRAGSRSDAWVFVQRARAERRVADSLRQEGDRSSALRTLRRADSLLLRARALDSSWHEPEILRTWVMRERALLAGDSTPMLLIQAESLATRLLRVGSDARVFELRGTVRLDRLARVRGQPVDTNGLLRAAESDLLEAVRQDSTRASAWSTLSALYFRVPDLAKVEWAASRSDAADPNYRYNRGDLNRLFFGAYNAEMFSEAGRWCARIRQRYEKDVIAEQCQLLLMRVPGLRPHPDSIWATTNRLISLSSATNRSVAEKNAHIFAAAALVAASLPDSARRVLRRARASNAEDKRRELKGAEASVRVLLGDFDEALRLLDQYLEVNPDHAQGFRSSASWWWRDIAKDPRYAAMLDRHSPRPK